MNRKINNNSSSKFSIDEIEKMYEKRKEIQEKSTKRYATSCKGHSR